MSSFERALEGPASAELELELTRQADQLLARVLEGRERVQTLRELAAAAEHQLSEDEAMLARIHELLGTTDQLSLDSVNTHLRGQRIREVALDILERREIDETEGVHYREWYGWLRDEGYTVAGRDPIAAFLAQVTRSPKLQRVGGQRSGRYRVRD